MHKFLNINCILFSLLVGVHGFVHAQLNIPEIVIIEPTAGQEATSIWRTINDYAFLEKMGYEIVLASHPIMDSLLEKSKQGTFSDQDFATIFQLTDSLFFDEDDYVQAISKVEAQREQINEMMAVIQNDHRLEASLRCWPNG